MTPWIIVPGVTAVFLFVLFAWAIFEQEYIKSRDLIGGWIGIGVAALILTAWTLDLAGVRL